MTCVDLWMTCVLKKKIYLEILKDLGGKRTLLRDTPFHFLPAPHTVVKRSQESYGHLAWKIS